MDLSVDTFTQNLIEDYFKGPSNKDFEDSLIQTLFQDNKYDQILNLLERGFELTPKIRVQIEKSCNLKLYQYLHHHQKLELTFSLFKYNIVNGPIETIKWLSEQTTHLKQKDDLMTTQDIDYSIDATQSAVYGLIIRHNRIDILHWFREIKYPIFDSRIITEYYFIDLMIEAGRLEMLQWLQNNNYINIQNCEKFNILSCDLEMLKWIRSVTRESIFESSEYIFQAASSGHLHIIQWLHEIGTPMDDDAPEIASECGHLQILQWLIENGCRYDKQTCIDAAREYNHFDVMEWLYSLA